MDDRTAGGDLILRFSLRNLCGLCASAVKENAKTCKPQRRRGRRDCAESNQGTAEQHM